MRAIVEYLSQRQGEFLADLAALVNLDCGTHNKAGVDTAGALMRRRLGSAGFAVETVPLKDYGDCLVGRLSGRGKARILLVGHLDTVYPDGTAAARPMRVEAGRVLGPGANDMKAGLLAGVYAATCLQAIGFDDFGEITFFCNSEEEVGSPVSRQLSPDLARNADAALVLEAARANGDIVSARKGGGKYRVQVTGRAAHAGVEPEKGANAIVELAHHIQALHALNGLRPGTTVNVGVIRGGTRTNVVPDRAEAEVDFRVVRREDAAVLDAALRQAMARVHVPGTTTDVAGGLTVRPMVKTPATAYLAGLARHVAAELGFPLNDVATGGTSDANFVAALGTPVLDGLGPIGGLDHSPDEYLELDSIVPRTALLAGLIQAICRERAGLVSLREALAVKPAALGTPLGSPDTHS